jgi:magnesium and cobalt transporter
MSDAVTGGKKSTKKGWIARLGQKIGGKPHNRKDLLDIFREAKKSHLLDKYALSMLEGVLQVSEQHVRDVMVPRKKMIVLDKDALLEKVFPIVIEHGHSRFPVITEDKSKVVGILMSKDLLAHALNKKDITVESIMRPAIVVPESKRLNVLLKEFRAKHTHMVIVIDEYGAVAGLVSIEDVLEKIVGEIEDEHDHAEEEYIVEQKKDEYTIQALTPIEYFNEYFNAEFDRDEFNTIGGFIVGRLEHMPKKGEQVTAGKFHFQVLQADGRRIQLLKVKIQTKLIKRKRRHKKNF